MTFTYSDTSVSTTLAKVRLRIGDTDSTDPLLTDEEIAVYTGDTTDINLCAVQCVEAILAKLARQIQHSGAGLSGSAQMKFDQYERLLERLKKAAGRGRIQAFAGGVSDSRNDSLRNDTDFPQPQATVGRDDYDRSGVNPAVDE